MKPRRPKTYNLALLTSQQGEIAALREKLAAAERLAVDIARERDELVIARGDIARHRHEAVRERDQQAALCAKLREALADCVSVMDEHADATLGACPHPSRTRTKSCRERGRKALAKPPSTDALREFGVRVAMLTTERMEARNGDVPCIGGKCVGYSQAEVDACAKADIAEFASECVARVLGQPDAGQPEGEA